MELQIKTIRTYGKNCIGCKRHKKDIMIAFTHEKEEVPNMVHDLFLTTEQAEELLDSLTSSLKGNKLEATY